VHDAGIVGVRKGRHGRVKRRCTSWIALIVLDPVGDSRNEFNRGLASSHAIEQASLQFALTSEQYCGSSHGVANVRSQRLSENCQARAVFPILRKNTCRNKSPQDSTQGRRMGTKCAS
jgi:hypothetical protein